MIMEYICIILATALLVFVLLFVREYRTRRSDVRKLSLYMDRILDGELKDGFDYDDKSISRELVMKLDDIRQELLIRVGDSVKEEKVMQEMLISISHDLKTPITSIKGYVEGLMDGICDNNPERKNKYLNTIYNKSVDMDKLIDALMLYAKLGTEAIRYDFKVVAARDFFDEYADALSDELEASKIRFDYKNSLTDAHISMDPFYFKRVIDNIISNSRKYCSEDPKISLMIEGEGDSIHICIEDNGPGIPAKDIPKIFNRFYRGNQARTNPEKGNGIGLAIVKKIVNDHGGKIWVESELGKGTCMHILIHKVCK
ncbi:MAG TPA: two-component sensor histidine kinase [Eubacterium sp.]|nr:two-component sensor histidine kinase [Eubacterium sp.]HBZ52809.1 two-component sensor histidine kinase [Eubacterium sp.]